MYRPGAIARNRLQRILSVESIYLYEEQPNSPSADKARPWFERQRGWPICRWVRKAILQGQVSQEVRGLTGGRLGRTSFQESSVDLKKCVVKGI